MGSAGASANTSSRAGTPLFAGPGTAHARPSAVIALASTSIKRGGVNHRIKRVC